MEFDSTPLTIWQYSVINLAVLYYQFGSTPLLHTSYCSLLKLELRGTYLYCTASCCTVHTFIYLHNILVFLPSIAFLIVLMKKSICISSQMYLLGKRLWLSLFPPLFSNGWRVLHSAFLPADPSRSPEPGTQRPATAGRLPDALPAGQEPEPSNPEGLLPIKAFVIFIIYKVISSQYRLKVVSSENQSGLKIGSNNRYSFRDGVLSIIFYILKGHHLEMC
jgi:hypothetical protein